MVDKNLVTSINVRFPKDLHKKLRKIAFDRHTSSNNLIVVAVEESLKRKGPKSNITNKKEFPRKQGDNDLQL